MSSLLFDVVRFVLRRIWIRQARDRLMEALEEECQPPTGTLRKCK